LPSGRRIALYFYHGGIAGGGLQRFAQQRQNFAERLLRIFDESSGIQLAHIATDGESYGHHHRFGEMALAAALNHIEDNKLATLTNYGQFLELAPAGMGGANPRKFLLELPARRGALAQRLRLQYRRQPRLAPALAQTPARHARLAARPAGPGV
jgi:hypothetical protein